MSNTRQEQSRRYGPLAFALASPLAPEECVARLAWLVAPAGRSTSPRYPVRGWVRDDGTFEVTRAPLWTRGYAAQRGTRYYFVYARGTVQAAGAGAAVRGQIVGTSDPRRHIPEGLTPELVLGLALMGGLALSGLIMIGADASLRATWKQESRFLLGVVRRTVEAPPLELTDVPDEEEEVSDDDDDAGDR